MTIKQGIIDVLNDSMSAGKLIKKYKEDDLGPYFWSIFYWQEIKKHSEAAHEAAWKVAQRAKVVKDDDDLRDLGGGEHIIADSKLFSFIARVDSPRQTFDPEKFIKLVAKKFKLDEDVLTRMAADCLKDSKPPLSKRILEVQK
jgi:hypothetical protein